MENTKKLDDSKKKRLRKEHALGELSQKFFEIISKENTNEINLKEISKKMKMSKRRIYDITNVLEGIGYIQKKERNKFIILKKEIVGNNEIDGKNFKKLNSQKEYNQLINEGKKLEENINKIKSNIDLLVHNPENKIYKYLSKDDLKLISKLNKKSLMAVEAPAGTEIFITDKEIIKNTLTDSEKEKPEKLEMQHQITIKSKGIVNLHLVLSKDEYQQFNHDYIPNSTGVGSPTKSRNYFNF